MDTNASQFVAHRGYQKHYPENTLLAVYKAIESGALHVEVDVQLSRDCVPMVYHDDTLDRMSDRGGKLCELDATELKQLPAHEPGRFGQKFLQEKIAPLAALVELIKTNPQVRFYIELKEEAVRDHGIASCLGQMKKVLDPVLEQCVLISFDLEALAEARHFGFGRLGAVLRDWGSRDVQIDKLEAAVMFINKKRIPSHARIVAHCPVVVYEVDNRDEAKQLLQRGAAMVETFAIGEMLGQVNVGKAGN